MEKPLAVQAKEVLTTFYHWVVDQQPHQATKQALSTVSSVASQTVSLASSYVDSILHHTSHPTPNIQHSSHSSSSSRPPVYDHTAAGGGASSYCYRNNFENSPQNNLLASFYQSVTHPVCAWKLWDPVASFDSFLWNYTPDIHALQEQLGLGHLSETYNINPRILVLVMVLPFILLLLASCVVLGAGNSSEDGPRYPGQRTDPMAVGNGKKKEKQKASRKQQEGAGAGGSSAANSSLSKKGANKQSGPSDAIENQQYLLGNNNGISSWSALLGSMGFLGGETMDYKPLDILASLKDGSNADAENAESSTTSLGSVLDSVSVLGSELMKQIPSYQQLLDQDIAQLLGSDLLDSDYTGDEDEASGERDNSTDHTKATIEPEIVTQDQTEDSLEPVHVDSPAATDTRPNNVKPVKVETILLPTATVEHSHLNQGREPVQQIQQQDNIAGRQSGQGPAGPEGDPAKAKTTRVASIPPPLRTRTPRPSSSFKESDRSKARPNSAATPTHQPGINVGRDFGSSVFGYVQESQLLKNMDTLSGGLLGSAVATVAALASTAESAAGIIKNNLPDSVTDFTDELRDSFDHAMRVQSEAEAEAERSKNRPWGVRDAISKIMEDDDNIAATAKANNTSSASRKVTPTPSTTAATATGRASATIRVPLPSGNAAPTSASTPSSEDISARPTGPIKPRVVDSDVLDLSLAYFRAVSAGPFSSSSYNRSSREGPLISEEALSEIHKSLTRDLASAMNSTQEIEKITSAPDATTTSTTVAPAGTPSAHTEQEDEDYYLENAEDSGEDADADDDEDDDDDGNDTDTFVAANVNSAGEGVQSDLTGTSGPISSRTRLHQDQGGQVQAQEAGFGVEGGSELDQFLHPHDEVGGGGESDNSSGGSIADDEMRPTLSTSTSTDTLSNFQGRGQEMTVDDHGNKVPVSTEVRRDSGFDLLL
ncbi:hypothetical protein BGX29_011533 [Mortierella sp. GBA35]|nr:hypothetical protein BGX29_011533 [Mortierella sp. GBA35]